MAGSASTGLRRLTRWDGLYVRTKGTCCPASTVNSARVVRFSPYTASGVCSQNASGPATARNPLPTRYTHGMIRP